jgi:hypothetical protein
MNSSRSLPQLTTSLSLALALIHSPSHANPSPKTLKVSANQRFLTLENDQPFFYLGDTAWELFHRLNREEATLYLQDRANKGFTVIQAVALAELDGLHTPNAYGHLPLLQDDPTQPLTVEGPNNDYWDHVDFIVQQANTLGLWIGFLPTWGDKWNKKWGVGPEIFNPENAKTYGQWIGQRYRNANVIWITGGDRPVENPNHQAIINAMAEGLRLGDQGQHLITFHPTGGNSSSDPFHNQPWLDFNMRQNGHVTEFDRYAKTFDDYNRTPTKPVLDGEPIYEDHPVSFNAREQGHSIAADIRRPLYWDLFSGAFGHTYGHHSVWQMWAPDSPPVNAPLMPWHEALQQPGAAQMHYGRKLMESRPFLTRIPDNSILTHQEPATAWPGAGRYRMVATRDVDRSYAMVYSPAGRRFSVELSTLSGPTLQAWWFNPRNGSATPAGTFPNHGTASFTPPDPGEHLDWILVLDNTNHNYPPPGQPYR